MLEINSDCQSHASGVAPSGEKSGPEDRFDSFIGDNDGDSAICRSFSAIDINHVDDCSLPRCFSCVNYSSSDEAGVPRPPNSFQVPSPGKFARSRIDLENVSNLGNLSTCRSFRTLDPTPSSAFAPSVFLCQVQRPPRRCMMLVSYRRSGSCDLHMELEKHNCLSNSKNGFEYGLSFHRRR